MGNLTPAMGLPVNGDKSNSERSFITKRISSGITYYYTPVSAAGDQTLCSAKDSPASTGLRHISTQLPSDSSPFLSESSLHTSVPSSRPLLLFFSWLGAHSGAVGKYRDLYLNRGMDVLWVRSNVMHFLWPRWGLNYGSEVLRVLEEPQFSGRAVLVHATSIGGYTFTQILNHIAEGHRKHAGLAQRVTGQIYDSLVVGSLEHMAIGLGKTLLPRLESLIKNLAMFYFWLFKAQTADLYNSSIQVFYNNPITAPALFFSSDNDVLCDQAVMEQCIDHWRGRGMTVESKTWKESVHAAHMKRHPEDYLCTLEKYLNSLHISSTRAEM